MQLGGNSFTDISFLNYVDLDDNESSIVHEMRNHPEIKKWMHNTDEIPLSEHVLFIQSLKKTDTKLYFLVKKKEQNIGAVNFNAIDYCNGNADLGLYVNPFESMRGYGSLLMKVAEIYACSTLKLNCLNIEVYSENERAYKLYIKRDFVVDKIEKRLGKEIIFMKKLIR